MTFIFILHIIRNLPHSWKLSLQFQFLKIIQRIVFLPIHVLLLLPQYDVASVRFFIPDSKAYISASKFNPQATNVIYMEHPFLMFLDHTQRRSTVGRTPLDE